ncbi:MAG: thiamine pyrophosphate-binding protein [Opitutae bacterium]|nr:thiamine pyrophosphate-binding protein [Opitutae bacterium]
MATIRVGDFIAEFLEQKGVDCAFMLSGGGMMHLQDALSRRKKLKYICNHHEQACTFAAEAYGRQRESIGVCYATSGPGASNTITGIVSAYQDSSPLIVIAGQAKVSDTIRGTGQVGLRQLGTFEIDMVPIVQSVTKYAVFLKDPQRVRFELEKAYHLATTGRPGPVYFEVPVDVQGAPIDPATLRPWDETPPAVPVASRTEVGEVLDLLLAAQRPLIFAGHGIRCAKEAAGFLRLVEKLGIPVVTTPMAADLIPHDHPLYIGHPGVKGDRAGNFSIQTADVVLIVGSSVRAQMTGYELADFAPAARKIHVDPDQPVLDSTRVGIQTKIRSCVGAFIRAANEIATTRDLRFGGAAWTARTQRWKKTYPVAAEAHRRGDDDLNYYDVIDQLSDACRGEETIIADAGCAFFITGQAFRSKPGQRLIFSGALAQMGYTLPAVTGACLGAPGRTIVGITGDGSLQTNIHELGVIVHHKLNAKILVINNHGYSCIANTQRNYFGGHYSGTTVKSGLSFPDLPKLCAAYGLPHLTTAKRSELSGLMQRFLAHEGPVLCEVFTGEQQDFVPCVTSVRLEDGRMQSKPLHEMYPLLSPEQLAQEMR